MMWRRARIGLARGSGLYHAENAVVDDFEHLHTPAISARHADVHRPHLAITTWRDPLVHGVRDDHPLRAEKTQRLSQCDTVGIIDVLRELARPHHPIAIVDALGRLRLWSESLQPVPDLTVDAVGAVLGPSWRDAAVGEDRAANLQHRRELGDPAGVGSAGHEGRAAGALRRLQMAQAWIVAAKSTDGLPRRKRVRPDCLIVQASAHHFVVADEGMHSAATFGCPTL